MDPFGSHGLAVRKALAARKKYLRPDDRTLTETQKTKGFAGARTFRARSNRTKRRYKSGYHESVLTTDHYEYLKKTISGGVGKRKLAPAKPQSFFARKGLAGSLIREGTLQYVQSIADGYRTDTAQTILSAEGGTVGGHSGSGVSLTGQAAAHDLLRGAVSDLLKKDPTTPGVTKKSIAVAFGAITVASIAPGELARQVDTSQLKAGSDAKVNWEVNRNRAKARVEIALESLDDDERRFVSAVAGDFIASTQRGRSSTRGVRKGRGTSPTRATSLDPRRPHDVAGGGYTTDPLDMPERRPPDRPEEFGYYFTEPFREART